ncbi:MAG: M1 family aminopeptidase [Bacteroidales bacterium]|jgi:aminopeptidase N
MCRNILFLICLAAQILPAQDFNLSWIDRDAAGRIETLKKRYSNDIKNGVSGASGMDIKFDRILLILDPAVLFVTGSVSTYFVRQPDNLHPIIFDLSDSLQITAIRYHGQLLTGFTRENNKLTIPLPAQPLTSGRPKFSFSGTSVTLDSIMVDYQGVPVGGGSESFALSKHDGTPILYTQSEPYGARDWWPCSQDLNDKIDSVHLVITVPPGNRAAANGMLISEQHCDDRSIYQWKHKHPIAAYLIGVSVTNYAVYSDYVPVENGQSIEILNYVYPETIATTRGLTTQIIKPFQLFNQLFGLYPFADERYGHAQWNWGGGMEHQTMSFMGSFGYDLLAHELGHQWFGDFVTCGSWRDIWLNEGFATYMVGLCYERDQQGIYWEPFKRLTISRIIRQPGGSVYCYDTTNVDRMFDARLSYSKGAMVLHMLRWEMGDEKFFKALNNYLKDPMLANGYATTKDLMRHVAVLDGDYTEFFNDWVFGQGYPTYQMIYRLKPGNELELEISQEQSDPSVSFFEMDLPVRVYRRGAVPLDMVLHHTSSGQLFKFNTGFAVDSVKFDPERWILTANPVVLNISDIPYAQQVRIYPNPVTDQINVQMDLPEDGLYIRLYNHKGQLITECKTSQTVSLYQISMKSFPNGIYMVEVQGRPAVKLVK